MSPEMKLFLFGTLVSSVVTYYSRKWTVGHLDPTKEKKDQAKKEIKSSNDQIKDNIKC